MTVTETPPFREPEPAVVEATVVEPAAIRMTGTLLLAVGVLALCGLVLGVGPMMWRSPGVRIPAGAARVNVSLYEYGVRLDPSTAVHAGKNVFVITNTGTIPHELVGFATSLPASHLPVRADGDVNEESAALHSVLDTGDSLAPGATKVIPIMLTAGTHYVFVCNLAGHWHLGMRLDVTPN